jgi:hypothetical protein
MRVNPEVIYWQPIIFFTVSNQAAKSTTAHDYLSPPVGCLKSPFGRTGLPNFPLVPWNSW